MNAAGLARIAALLGAVACSNGHAGAASARTLDCTREGTMAVIDEGILRETLAAEGSVAVVGIRNAKIRDRGTRSERATHSADVLEPLAGEIGSRIDIWYHTSQGVTRLEKDCTYVVALANTPQYRPAMRLRGSVAVPPDSVQAATEAHRRLIAQTDG